MAKPAALKLLPSNVQHGPGKVESHNASGRRPRSARRNREVRGAGAKIEDPLNAGQGQRSDGAYPPPPIDANRQQMIQKVVPGCDRVKHPRNAIGSLGGRWGDDTQLKTTLVLNVDRDGQNKQVQNSDIAVQIE